MAYDPLWNTDRGFKNGYMVDLHKMRCKEARCLWNMKFSYLDELELVYGKDRFNRETIVNYEDVVNNLDAEEKSTASYVNCKTDDEISISTSRMQKKQTIHLYGIASHFASIATAMTNEYKHEQLASDRSNSLVIKTGIVQMGYV
ncbi:hypothetical protein ACH5RR_015945 [Cinchona calisaya]|uniref:Uncharacterized protein n=1 Tax=Cinchona calisaya TaxID=153742 RepID=A0ABD2ZUI2_9GENT